MGKDVIVACDFASAEATFAFLDKFAGCARKPFLKIGMELYYAEGPSIVKEIKARGHKIFLDLKLHDIPNTVKKAMAVLSNLDVDITNLHAAGTTAMMKGALEGLTRPDGTRPLLISRSFSMASWSVEVSWVTAISRGRVPSGRVRPSRAPFIMAVVPAACRLVMSTSRLDRTAIAFLTVLGMSCSFRSRKILWPRALISLTMEGPSA